MADDTPTSTVDLGQSIPAAFVGHQCGSLWASHVKSESSINHLARWVRLEGAGAKLADAAAAGVLKLDGLPEDVWPAIWSGPELAAIDLDDKARAEFWK